MDYRIHPPLSLFVHPFVELPPQIRCYETETAQYTIQRYKSALKKNNYAFRHYFSCSCSSSKSSRNSVFFLLVWDGFGLRFRASSLSLRF